MKEPRSFELPIQHIGEKCDQAVSYIERRKTGQVKSIRIKSTKINDAFMDGFEWGRMLCIAGLSGSGKSTLLRQIIREALEIQKEEQIFVLSFQFEMLGSDEVARDIIANTKISLEELYSVKKSIKEEVLHKVKSSVNEIKELPIWVVDTHGTTQQIYNTIVNFKNFLLLNYDNPKLIVTIDHTLLVKGENRTESDKLIIDELMKSLVDLKLLLSKEISVFFIVLSMLNRDIEDKERVTNKNLHYPNKNDIFAASSIYYCCDYVIIIHSPSIIVGMENYYGPATKKYPKGLPVYSPKDPDIPLIYLHVIKNRFGKKSILVMEDHLEYGMLKEH